MTYAYEGLLEGDSFSGALSRAEGNGVGTYAIAQGTLTAGDNYSISFTSADFTITAKPLTVTATSGLEKIYGDDDPELTYTSVGLLEGDSFSGALSRAEGDGVGTYAIAQGTLTAGDNYSISFTSADFTITAKPLTVTATSGLGKVYGDADPELTYTYEGLLEGDALSGALSRAEGDGVGTYAIAQGTLTAGDNYSISFTGAEFAITKRPITLTANSVSGEYKGSAITYSDAADAESPYYTISDGSLADNQEITSIALQGVGVTVGEYDINITEGSVAIGDYTSNYNITLEKGTLTITANTTAITVVPGSGSKEYDGTALTKTAHDDFTVTGVPDNFTWTAAADGTVTNVVPGDGEKAVNAVTEFKIFNLAGDDVTNQFSRIDVSATGTLTINPKMSVYDFLTVEESGSSTVVSINGDIPSILTGNELSTSVEATEVTYTRTFDTPYATICLPFAVSASEAAAAGKFYQFTEITDNYEVVMTEVKDDDLAADTPYIIAPASNDKVSFSYTGTGAVTISLDVEPSTSDADWAFKGTYKVKSFKNVYPDDDKAIYFFASTDQKDDEENVEIHAGDFVITDTQDDATKAAPFRAYLEYTGDGNLSLSSSSATGRDASASIMPRTLKVIIVNGDGTITKIGSISVSGEDKWFTIDGIQIEGQPTEGGMYIRNGRAVMVK